MDFVYIIKDFIKCKGDLKQFICNRAMPFFRSEYWLLPKEYFKDSYLTLNNISYSLNSFDDESFSEVIADYNYNDIRSDDIVLDIGANLGYFSLAVFNNSKKVYAVEPLFISELQHNIELNHAQENILILPYALSLSDLEISYAGKIGKASGKSLSELIQMCGGHVDVLKCDCEGGEWCIRPEELLGIRRIEMEIHSFNGENTKVLIDMLVSCGYSVDIERKNDKLVLVHAFDSNDGELR